MAQGLNITYDSHYITYAGMKSVKARAKEFKACTTPNDLLRAFVEQCSRARDIFCGEETIIFNSVDTTEDPYFGINVYHVRLVIEIGSRMYRVRFVIDENMEVHVQNEILWEIEKFVKER